MKVEDPPVLLKSSVTNVDFSFPEWKKFSSGGCFVKRSAYFCYLPKVKILLLLIANLFSSKFLSILIFQSKMRKLQKFTYKKEKENEKLIFEIVFLPDQVSIFSASLCLHIRNCSTPNSVPFLQMLYVGLLYYLSLRCCEWKQSNFTLKWPRLHLLILILRCWNAQKKGQPYCVADLDCTIKYALN